MATGGLPSSRSQATAAALDRVSVSWASQCRPNVQRAGEQVRGVCYGVVWARARGPCVSAQTIRNPEVVKMLTKLARDALPAVTFSSIQVNKSYAAALHLDANNEGESHIVGVGDFEGGELWVHRQVYSDVPWEPRVGGVAETLDVRSSFATFDGNMPHCTLPFTGTRYSIIYYTNTGHMQLPDEERDRLLALGFPLPEKLAESESSNQAALAYPKRADRLAAGQEAYRRWRLLQSASASRPLPTHVEIMPVGEQPPVEARLSETELRRVLAHARQQRRMRCRLLRDEDDGPRTGESEAPARACTTLVQVHGVAHEELARMAATSPPPVPLPRRRFAMSSASAGMSPTTAGQVICVGPGLARVQVAYRRDRTHAVANLTVGEALRTQVPDRHGGTSSYCRNDLRYDLARGVIVLKPAEDQVNEIKQITTSCPDAVQTHP